MTKHSDPNYLEVNRKSWNERVALHVAAPFYNMDAFRAGHTSLNDIELKLLGDVSGKRILHLQCHFGQDSISLAKMGATVVAIDLSDKAIDAARTLADEMNVDVTFHCCDVYDVPNHVSGDFDIIYTSYGVIGWLPDLNKWAAIIHQFLQPNGKFLLVEFHPVVWMFDDDFQYVKYNYFKDDPIIETNDGTYADNAAPVTLTSVTWNHSLSEVISSCLNHGLSLKQLAEYDYSPYNCFVHTIEFEPGKYRIKHMENRIPMVYAMEAIKI